MRALALAAILAAAAPAAASYAQTTAPASPAAGPRDHRPMMDPAQRAQHRAERLRAVLQLRPEQEPALTAYLQALQPPAGAREAWQARRGQVAAMTTPQRIEAMRKGMEARRARFDQHAQATLRFYAQLSPAQQKAFDAMGPQGGKGMRGGRGDRGGFHG